MPVTVEPVLPGDTKDAGRIKWNQSDENLKNALNSLEQQQSAHVGEGHPSMYYNKAEIDSQQTAQNTSLSSEATARQASDNIINAALNTHKTSGDHDSRYMNLGQLSNLLKKGVDFIVGLINDKINFQYYTIQAMGKDLATKEYVTNLLQASHGGFIISDRKIMTAIAAGSIIPFLDEGGVHNKYHFVPAACRLVKLRGAVVRNGEIIYLEDVALSVAIEGDLVQVVRFEVVVGADDGIVGCPISIKIYSVTYFGQTDSLIGTISGVTVPAGAADITYSIVAAFVN